MTKSTSLEPYLLCLSTSLLFSSPLLFFFYYIHLLSMYIKSRHLSLQSNSALGVGDLETELLGLSNNLDSVLSRNVVGDLSSEGLGVHQQWVQVLQVADNNSLVARWHHVLGLLVGTVTDVWLRDGTSESSSDTRVNTLLLSPVLSDTVESVRLVSLELTGKLLHDLWVCNRGGH